MDVYLHTDTAYIALTRWFLLLKLSKNHGYNLAPGNVDY